MIHTEKLTKVFSTEEIETYALSGADIQVNKGEFVAIMGPSGCGKSTLLNILGLLDNPTEGKYVFNGTDISNLKEKDRTQHYLDIAGVDLLFNEGTYTICEVNSAPGFKGMEKYTKINVAEEMVNYVVKKIGG